MQGGWPSPSPWNVPDQIRRSTAASIVICDLIVAFDVNKVIQLSRWAADTKDRLEFACWEPQD